MTIRQISVFIDDKAGSLVRVLDVLKEEGHQIITSTLTDSPEFAIYRVLCTDPDKAYESLHKAGFNVMMPDVFALVVDDEPGMAARAIGVIAEEGISVRYMYSFLLGGKGILVLRTHQTNKAQEVITLAKLKQASESELKSLMEQSI
ncbi:MAG: amino acid-binding protein [Bacteroidales bacterium]|nr:amino acid-binding protein [Bacteroidales bacterium]